jgi:hypothetical protein
VCRDGDGGAESGGAKQVGTGIHPALLGARPVIVAEDVQYPVGEQVEDLVGEGAAMFLRLASCGLE